MTIGALDLAGPDELVEGEPGPRALAVAEPADPGRQALERDPRLGHLDPAMQAGVVGEQLEDGPIGPEDVGRVAGQRGPAERAATLAELRPDEGGHEARIVERVLDARLEGERAQVVAVVEDDRAGPLEGEHRLDVARPSTGATGAGTRRAAGRAARARRPGRSRPGRSRRAGRAPTSGP